jgi:hypothetical protein
MGHINHGARLMKRVARFIPQLLIALIQGVLVAWACCLPIVWIVRDGLGPDSHETGWAMGILKTLTIWGIPALAFAVPLCGLKRLQRSLAGSDHGEEHSQSSSCDHHWFDRDEMLNYDPKYLRCSKCGEGRWA